MGWSCLKTQSEALDRIRKWELSQPGFVAGTPGEIFFDFSPGGKDYGHKPFLNMEVDVFEMAENGTCFKRGFLIIEPDGRILARSPLSLPDFNNAKGGR